ncbi:protein that induces appearance of [PIN+] prion when overproduced [Diplodia seriata]|uniref:Protein that induces appearance of [PIN+] prion when overproduced n=3 Tax=Diplodia TaxID=66735 RepID=A0A0G2E063_9PEZI|nr:putative sh3 domain protein [Diplodia seriata]
MEQFSVAMMNRAVRNIKTELDFLCDAGHITPAQFNTIVSQLPDAAPSRASSIAPVASPQPTPAAAATPALPIRNSTPVSAAPSQPPAHNEKVGYYANNPTPPPPAYAAAPPAPAALCTATALYAYSPTDAGDLALQANDRVQVTEYMNAEWWKGRSERTGQEGIFPRSYVRVEDSKMPVAGPTPAQQSMGYGNMPMAVTQGGDQQNGQPSKGGEMGKKVGKKLGNAALFGAGATFGSNIVNGIM